jgi:hypothetical protein
MKARFSILCGATILLATPHLSADPSLLPSPTPGGSAVPVITPMASASPGVSPSEADQDEPVPKKPGVRLQFVPPPMEGTISLGVYDSTGKLVRTVEREAEAKGGDFVIANDGLVTSWDGADDTGKRMPAGKYTAHGWMVGDLQVKGEDTLGNDWVTDDDSPRIRAIKALIALPDGGFGISAELVDKTVSTLCFDAKGEPTPSLGGLKIQAVIRAGKVILHRAEGDQEVPAEGLVSPIFAAVARDGGVWVIDHGPGGVSVKQFTADGTFERHLAINPAYPQPEQIAASQVTDTIFLLESNAQGQQVRALTLVPQTNPPTIAQPSPATETEKTSIWKIDWQKKIWKLDSEATVLGRLKFPDGKPFVPSGKIEIPLIKDPMDEDHPASVSVMADREDDGSYLKAADGLPLRMISDTTNLQWIALGQEAGSKTLVVFQSDGAVIEEYLLAHPERMIRFDCGDFDLP